MLDFRGAAMHELKKFLTPCDMMRIVKMLGGFETTRSTTLQFSQCMKIAYTEWVY